MVKLSPVMQQAFRQIGYGCLPIYASADEINWQADFLVRLPTTEIKSLGMKTAKVETSIALYETDNFPLVLMLITIHAIPGDPAKMECFFNLTSNEHRQCLESLTRQTNFRLHLFGDDLKYSHSKEVSWYLQQAVIEILWKAQPMVEGKADMDFEKVKAKFIHQNKL